MSKEVQLRAWLREAVAEKQEATEAREGLAFDNLKLARRVAELTTRLETRGSGSLGISSSFGSLLGWETPPQEGGAAEELFAKVQENEYLQGALIEVQRSHSQTLRLQTVQQSAEVSVLLMEIESAEQDIGRSTELAAASALERAEVTQQKALSELKDMCLKMRLHCATLAGEQPQKGLSWYTRCCMTNEGATLSPPHLQDGHGHGRGRVGWGQMG